jgi:hypothetical protein
MFIALLLGYGVVSILVTVIAATFLRRTRERVAVSLPVRGWQPERAAQDDDYGQRAA